MTTAQVLIEAAYARSTANDPGKLATDAELLGRLNRTYQMVYGLAAKQRPDEFATLTTLTLGVPPQVALPVDLIEVRRLLNALGAVVHLIPAAELTRLWNIPPCVYRLGSTLYSRGQAGDPITGDVLTAQLLLSGTTLSALSTSLDATYPTRHVELLSNDLALYLDLKDEGRDPSQFQKLAADQAVKLAAFAQDFDLDASVLEFAHSPVSRVPAASGSSPR